MDTAGRIVIAGSVLWALATLVAMKWVDPKLWKGLKKATREMFSLQKA